MHPALAGRSSATSKLTKAVAVSLAVSFGVQRARMSSSYTDKHTQVNASFDDVKNIQLISLPKTDPATPFAASTLWKDAPAVVVVLRRPG